MMRDAPPLPRRVLAEATGTFFLVLIGAGSVVLDFRTGGGLGRGGIAAAFATVVTAMILLFGRVSGAHINPAVTLAFWSGRRFPGREVVPYVLAQCVGAVAAGVLLVGWLGPPGQAGATVPRVSLPAALLIEGLLSFVLMAVIASVAMRGGTSPLLAAPAIGFTVGLDAFLGGPSTGASMNPARSLGPAIAGGAWDAHWVYWVAPIIAMILAVQLFQPLFAFGLGDPRGAGGGRW